MTDETEADLTGATAAPPPQGRRVEKIGGRKLKPVDADDGPWL